MTDKQDGGPAFPCSEDVWEQPQNTNRPPELVDTIKYRGLSLRDYFAAKAMQGFLSNPQISSLDFGEIVADAYNAADAMLRERSK